MHAPVALDARLLPVFAAVLLLLAGAARGYPDGAPPSACLDMTPLHGAQPQPASSFPFDVSAERESGKEKRWRGVSLLLSAREL